MPKCAKGPPAKRIAPDDPAELRLTSADEAAIEALRPKLRRSKLGAKANLAACRKAAEPAPNL